MDEILKVSIQEVEINMKKKGFSEIASSNDNETDDDVPTLIQTGDVKDSQLK